MMARDAALLRIHVMRERETVMDLEMEVSMMDTKDVKEILFVDPTIVSSLELTSILRMTVVSNLIARRWTTVFMVSILNTYNLSCLLIEFRVGSLGSMDFE